MKLIWFENSIKVFSVVLICAMLSCKPDSPPNLVTVEAPNLIGTWKMHEAYKGNNVTKLLDNAYFKFHDNGTMATNILGDESAYAYKVEKGSIKVESPKAQSYNVISKSSDTLILTTRLRNFDFKFITLKSDPE